MNNSRGLGYCTLLDHEGLRSTEDEVKAIREAPEPRNVTELQAFLGLLNYYSHFLPNLSNTVQAFVTVEVLLDMFALKANSTSTPRMTSRTLTLLPP